MKMKKSSKAKSPVKSKQALGEKDVMSAPGQSYMPDASMLSKGAKCSPIPMDEYLSYREISMAYGPNAIQKVMPALGASEAVEIVPPKQNRVKGV